MFSSSMEQAYSLLRIGFGRTQIRHSNLLIFKQYDASEGVKVGTRHITFMVILGCKEKTYEAGSFISGDN